MRNTPGYIAKAVAVYKFFNIKVVVPAFEIDPQVVHCALKGSLTLFAWSHYLNNCWETVLIGLPKWTRKEQKDKQQYVVPYRTDGTWRLQDKERSQCDMRSIIGGKKPSNGF